jgi:integrase
MRQRKLGSHLEWHRGQVRVVVSVPRGLQSTLGKTKLKAALGTDSPARAESLKWEVIGRLKAQLNAAARPGDTLASEALQWREALAKDTDDDSTTEHLLTERAQELEETHGEAAAVAFYDVAQGRATPLKTLLETYLKEATMKPRSKSEARLAITRLEEWLTQDGGVARLEAVNRRAAGRFISERLAPHYAKATVNKHLSFLSGYWGWLTKRGHVEDNPWLKQAFKSERRQALGDHDDGGERPYTDDEAGKLFHGPASARMKAVMHIAALSGMRIDEVCRLHVGDCIDGWFAVNARRGITGEGKSDAAARRVPVHSSLTPLVERLTKNRKPGDYLIADLPPVGGNRERSMPASKEFTRYRRAVGVDERPGDKRRSNVNFHSWRRWFVMKARDAGVSPWTIADVVGHDTKSMPLGLTMGTYPGRAAEADIKACVEAVVPPAMPAEPVERVSKPGRRGRRKGAV